MDLKNLISYLGDKYVIIGAYAMRFYGYIRNTVDLDILVNWSNEDFRKFEYILQQENIEYEVNYISEIDISESLGTILSCNCGGEIQLIQSKYIWQKDAVKNYVVSKFGFRIVDKYYLALLKLDAHGFKDLEDLKYLISMKDFEKNFFCKLLKKYRFDKKYSKILSLFALKCL